MAESAVINIGHAIKERRSAHSARRRLISRRPQRSKKHPLSERAEQDLSRNADLPETFAKHKPPACLPDKALMDLVHRLLSNFLGRRAWLGHKLTETGPADQSTDSGAGAGAPCLSLDHPRRENSKPKITQFQ